MNTPGKFALICAVLATSALAATTVTQSVEPQQLGTEDVAQVMVEVGGDAQGAQVELPATRDFEILGRSTSTSTSMRIDGSGEPVVERTLRHTFTIHPTRAGTLTIPAAKVRVGGQVLSGAEQQVEVSEGRRAQPRSRAARADPFASIFGADPFAGMGGLGGGSLFDRFFEDFEEQARPRPFDAKLFATLDQPSVYAGEQATVSFYLATRSNLSSVGGLRLPTIDGAAMQDLDVGKKLTPQPMTLGGKEYQGFLVARRVLFARKAGTLEIPAATLEVSGAGPNRTLRSAPLRLEVKPLPPGGERGEPVGTWSMDAAFTSSTEAQVGQAVPLQVTVQGTGDLQALPEPVLELPANARALAPTVKDTPRIRGTTVGGMRTWEFMILPGEAGPLTVPALRLPYFNPQTGRHEVARTAPLTVQVAPAPGAAAPVATAATPPPEAPVQAAPAAEPPAWRLWVPIVAAGLLLLAALGFVVSRWRKSRAGRPPSARAQRRDAARTLADAHSAAKSGKQAEAIRLTEEALTTIARASGLAPETADIDQVARDASRPSSAAWAQTMLQCRRARFMRLEPEVVSDILARADRTLDELPRQPR